MFFNNNKKSLIDEESQTEFNQQKKDYSIAISNGKLVFVYKKQIIDNFSITDLNTIKDYLILQNYKGEEEEKTFSSELPTDEVDKLKED